MEIIHFSDCMFQLKVFQFFCGVRLHHRLTKTFYKLTVFHCEKIDGILYENILFCCCCLDYEASKLKESD